MTLYSHSRQCLVRVVIILWHYIFTPDNIWWGGDYSVTLYFHPWKYLVREWLYRDITFSLLKIFGEGGDYIFTPDNIWWGGWLYRDITFSLLTIFVEGVIISWHYIFTPRNIWWGGDYIVTLHFHSWQYLVRGWLYRDITFSIPTIFGDGGDNIVTLHFYSWQYLVRGWLYRDITFLSRQYLVRGWLYRDLIFSHLTLPRNLALEVIIFEYFHYPRLTQQIPGFYHSYTYIHPIELGGWSYLSMIPSLLLKLSISGGYVDGLHQQSVINKNRQKSIKKYKKVPIVKAHDII